MKNVWEPSVSTERFSVNKLVLEDPRVWPEATQYLHRVQVGDEFAFLANLSFKSTVTFICASCDGSYLPHWFPGPLRLDRTSCLSLTSQSAMCMRCHRKYRPELLRLQPDLHRHNLRQYHASWTYASEARTLFGEVTDVLSLDVLDSVLLVDELVGTLTRIKGKIWSQRLRERV